MLRTIWRASSVLTALALLLAGCALGTPAAATIQLEAAQLAALVSSNAGMRLGNDTAPVVVVEFADFQCPGCKESARYIFPIVKEFVDAGQVRYYFKDFPLPQHAHARLTSAAAHCAGEQDQWVPMHDLLYERQARWANAADPKAQVMAYAAELGVDTARFEACLESERVKQQVDQSFQEAMQLKVQNTPTLLVQGKEVLLTPENVRSAITEELKRANP